jgi:NAD-dependent deacetylase
MTLSDADLQAVDRVVELLAASRSLLFITGAGVSADSGLPTYRGIGGLYNAEATEEGLAIEVALSGDVLRQRPDITWKYLAQIGRAAQGKTFNRAHEVIALMERRYERVCTLTQNIDRFHRRAGSQNVIEIHGDLHDLLCTACALRQEVEDFDTLPIPPRCPECRAVMRPDVVLFGETLPERKLEQLYGELDAGFDMVFSIGTTSVFPYIMQPVLLAHELGWPTVEINPGESRVSDLVDIRIAAGAAAALDALWQRLEETTETM